MSTKNYANLSDVLQRNTTLEVIWADLGGGYRERASVVRFNIDIVLVSIIYRSTRAYSNVSVSATRKPNKIGRGDAYLASLQGYASRVTTKMRCLNRGVLLSTLCRRSPVNPIWYHSHTPHRLMQNGGY